MENPKRYLQMTEGLSCLKKIAITGGPCGGKSTLLKMARVLLEKHGFKVIVVPEVAREFIAGGIVPWDPDWRESGDFQKHIFLGILEKEARFLQAIFNQYLGEKKVVFLCDRGLVDGMAYSGEVEFKEMLALWNIPFASVLDHYDGVIHLKTAAYGAEEFYVTDEEKVETPEQARERDDKTLAVWLQHSHLSVIDNSTDFPRKINRAILALSRILHMPKPIEIEKKFEVKNFRPELIPQDAKSYEIVQTYLYLHDRPGIECRVRAKTTEGQTSYFYTEKTLTEEEGVRGEQEERISHERYEELLSVHIDMSCKSVAKTRYKFSHDSRVFELDVFHGFLSGLVLLEVEVHSVEELSKIVPPVQFEVIDRTGNQKYSNWNLSQYGIPKD